MSAGRIFLSPPWVGDDERKAVAAAFDTGYVAPCGPFVDELERRLAALSSRRHAVAVASGTAALDLVMAHLGVTVMAYSACRGDIAAGRLHACTITGMHLMREISLIYEDDFTHPEILDEVRKMYAALN